MSEMLQTGKLPPDNLRLMAYLRHMAQTAQPSYAKCLFEMFEQQEKQWTEANGSSQFQDRTIQNRERR